jgi:hypothetical protein
MAKKKEWVFPKVVFVKQFTTNDTMFIEFDNKPDFVWYVKESGAGVVYCDNEYLYIVLDIGIACVKYDRKEILKPKDK